MSLMVAQGPWKLGRRKESGPGTTSKMIGDELGSWMRDLHGKAGGSRLRGRVCTSICLCTPGTPAPPRHVGCLSRGKRLECWRSVLRFLIG